MFTLLAVVTTVATILALPLFVAGLLRRRWLLCLGGVLAGGGALGAGILALRAAPFWLLEFLESLGSAATASPEVALIISLVALALAIADVSISTRFSRR